MDINRRSYSTVAIVIVLILFLTSMSGQIGGRSVYEFINLPSSSRVTALGGSLITVADDDVALGFQNPALITDSMRHNLTFNHSFLFAGTSHGTFNYGLRIPKTNLDAHLGVKYISYGDFVRADEIGNEIGSFSARETAITMGAGYQLNERIRIGANLSAIFSSFESYSSTGLTTDLGIHYLNKQSKFAIGGVIKSLGVQLSSFTSERSKTPLDIQIAVSKQLRYLPFRITITAHQLQQWSIRYDDPNIAPETDLFGQEVSESKFSNELDNFFRHFIFSGEFLLGKHENLRLRIGYRHLMRRELSVADFRSLSGFSGGFGLKISKFRIDYGLGYHHLAGASNHLSFSANLREWRKKL